MVERVIDNNWNFSGANTKEYSHCYHSYPAMMIPQIARKIIKDFSPYKTRLIFDPYCGSGTSLVEAKLANINSAGTDLNPMATMITKAKLKNYDYIKIKKYYNQLSDELFRFSFNTNSIDVKLNHFKNIDFWFTQKSIKEISFILQYINNQIEKDLRDFFIIPLSEALREVSYTRNGEFKLYRIPKEKRETHQPDTFGIYLKKLSRNIKGLNDLNETGVNTETSVYNFDTCEISPEKIIQSKIDFVVTSPPYGDSKTTVAYGQFSRLSNQWLGIKNASKIDNLLMGGSKYKCSKEFDSAYANEELKKIKSIDEKRFKEVLYFLNDYSKSIQNVSASVRKKGRIAYVVGNRTVKGVQIPLDYITVELFERNNCKHLTTIVREIPNKRMPSKNSPTNKKGKKSSTMKNEYIIIMEKN